MRDTTTRVVTDRHRHTCKHSNPLAHVCQGLITFHNLSRQEEWLTTEVLLQNKANLSCTNYLVWIQKSWLE